MVTKNLDYINLFYSRGKIFTNGDDNTVTMGLKNCKAEDEGNLSQINKKNLYFSTYFG